MTTSIQINSVTEANRLIEETKAHQDAEREAAAQAKPNTSNKLASNLSISHTNGKTIMRDGSVSRGSASASDLKHGQVRLANGMVTDYESAVAADVESAIVEFGKGLFSEAEHTAKLETIQRHTRKQQLEQDPPLEFEKRKQGAAHAEERQDKQTDLDFTAEETEAIKKAGGILNQAREAHGNHAVEAMQGAVVSGGELPSEAELPEGVTTEQVQDVVAAYTAQADAVLRTAGANVALLEETLTDNELKQARVAVFKNDDAALQSLGHKAVARLQQMPEQDPGTFKRLTANWPGSIKVSKREGRHWVDTPEWSMPWSDVVASGRVKLA